MHSHHLFPGIQEDFLVWPVAMSVRNLVGYEIVVAKPEDAKRQEKWILVASRVSYPCENCNLTRDIH